MFESLRFRKRDVLEEPRRLSTADYLCRLMEEQNQLLREMLGALGRHSAVPKANPAVNGRRIYTDKDVMRVTREDVEQLRRQEAEKTAAPWRAGGPGTPQTSPNAGTAPIATGVDGSPAQ